MHRRPFLYWSLALVAPACASEHGALVNQMAHTATPYLARAARQPVSWQPWSREVFALAARLDRPVLLYVGAEDCRWCTVMDREVYSDPDLGAMIDSLFVPVRVDRDERPDVAQRYQGAVLSLAGLRGYPLTVFLTPDGSPFFGGTYFPADDPVTGRGLKQLLPDVARDFRDRRDVLVRHAAVVRQLALSRALGAHGVLRPQALAAEVVAVRGSLASAVASGHALAGVASTQSVALLITEYIRSGDTAALAVARTAVDAMLDTEAVAAATSEEPPEIVRASLARVLSLAWVATAQSRYYDAGRAHLAALLHGLTFGGGRQVFADRDGYAISSAITTADALRDSVAQRRAVAALDTLLRRVYAPGRGVRHVTNGTLTGLLQDQVMIGDACVAAYTATGRPHYLEVAKDLAAILSQDFADFAGGFFDVAVSDAPVVDDRMKPVFDEMLPGPNAWAAHLLLGLAAVTGVSDYRRRAEATLEAFAGAVQGEGLRGSSFLLVAREALATRDRP
ncbi:MAG TPA: DUF255 domain-containing protein [Gemmatimonadales bacterium]|nr:DUF255 domain-containing protein [Gemmatimonadales bacterium]